MVICEQLETDGSYGLRTGDNYAIATKLCATLLGEIIGSVGIRFVGGTITDGTISCCRWPNAAALNQTNAANLLSAADHTFWSADATSIGTGMFTPGTQSVSDTILANVLIGIVITNSTGTEEIEVATEASNPTSLDTYKMRSNDADVEAWALTYSISTSAPIPPSTGTRLPPIPIVLRF